MNDSLDGVTRKIDPGLVACLVHLQDEVPE
jgi:hypothetical protein